MFTPHCRCGESWRGCVAVVKGVWSHTVATSQDSFCGFRLVVWFAAWRCGWPLQWEGRDNKQLWQTHSLFCVFKLYSSVFSPPVPQPKRNVSANPESFRLTSAVLFSNFLFFVLLVSPAIIIWQWAGSFALYNFLFVNVRSAWLKKKGF